MNSRAKINLMHAVLDMDLGGLQRLIAETTMVMDRERFNIEVVCYDRLGCFADYLTARGIQVTLLQKKPRSANLLYPLRLAKFLRQKKVHILHMHPGAFVYGCLAGAMVRTPALVYTEHGRAVVEDPVRLVEDRISGFFVHQMIAVSKNLETYLAEVVHLPAKKICTVINGIRTEKFARREKAEKLLMEFNLTDRCKVIGTVSRLDAVKDQLSMIKAFQIVNEKIPDSKLLIVGEGHMRETLTEHIVKNNLQDKVIITGQRQDVPELLHIFDLFVLSSLSEGTSVSLLEAMAAGLPPVVTNVGGNPDIVKNGENGLVVEPKDTPALADAILEILTDPAMYERFSKNAVATVKQNYSIEKMVATYTDIYLKLLRRKRKFKDLTL
ncbi:MAG: glycosyltransferase [candidate division Zixibacteria bacterium]|nr:glycosyltransferase [candidate division Zixibacteria bacterium]